MKKWIPRVLTAIFGLWLIAGLFSHEKLRDFAELPVLLNGRVQPLDSVARNALLQIRERQTVLFGDQSISAIAWFAELAMKSSEGDSRAIFRIDHPDLLALLKLDEHTKYFSFAQLRPGLADIDAQATRIRPIDAQTRSPFERAVMKLENAIRIFQQLKYCLRPPDTADFTSDLQAYVKAVGPGAAAARAEDANSPALAQLASFVERFRFQQQMTLPLVIPPRDGAASTQWENMGASLLETVGGAPLNPALTHYAAISDAFRSADQPRFAAAVQAYRDWLTQHLPQSLKKGGRETFFNDFAPFYKALTIYIAALILACGALALISWPRLSEVLRRSALWLIALAWLVHTFGLVFRMVLEGRPPVTNLYSSAIFIGWAAVIFGLALERIFKLGIGNLIASLAGFVTLVIAHNLALSGDTMEMLRAVLDTNFWLATHVVVVTLGYSATFVAGIVGITFVLLGVFTERMTPEMRSSLGKMMYGTVCFATLFSFVGTILGGIWADQSWGRFWGWDPKENGALLIVIWNAIILHARWGGFIRERGIANMTIFGNVVTSFSWFGVNMLGVGLHSYGFMDHAFKWLIAFVATQLILIAFGVLPLNYWKSAGRSRVTAL